MLELQQLINVNITGTQILFGLKTVIHPRFWVDYFLDLYEHKPASVLFEIITVLIILFLLNRKPYDPNRRKKLTKQEEDEIIQSWKPQPLCPELPPHLKNEKALILESTVSSKVVVNGRNMVNFAATNFLGLADHPQIKKECAETIEKYGVGSCGPRGFYGSIDVHLHLEKEISKFFGTEEAILYSDGIACASSVIPAFAKRGDLIICDEGVSYGVQQGVDLSRSNVLYYKHNDMDDLKRVLEHVKEKDKKIRSSKLHRRFIVCEGLSPYHADIVPLKTIVKLKYEYKYRLILEDSYGIGVLGNTGRGTTEYWGVPIRDIDFLCGTLDNSFATVGGFCVGSQQVIDHQRLSGAGYCFSASSPPYTATAGIVALQLLQQPEYADTTTKLNKQTLRMRRALKKSLSDMGVLIGGDDNSPIIHLRLQRSIGSTMDDQLLLTHVSKEMLKHEIVIPVSKYIPAEKRCPPPSVRIFVTVLHSEHDIDHTAELLRYAFRNAMAQALQKVEREIRWQLTSSDEISKGIDEAKDESILHMLSHRPNKIDMNTNKDDDHSRVHMQHKYDENNEVSMATEDKKEKGKNSIELNALSAASAASLTEKYQLTHMNTGSPSFQMSEGMDKLKELKMYPLDDSNNDLFFQQFSLYQNIAWLKPIVDRVTAEEKKNEEIEMKKQQRINEMKMEQLRSPIRKIHKLPYTGGAVNIGNDVWVYSSDGNLAFHSFKWMFDAFTEGLNITNLNEKDDVGYISYSQPTNIVQLMSSQSKIGVGESMTKIWAKYHYTMNHHHGKTNFENNSNPIAITNRITADGSIENENAVAHDKKKKKNKKKKDSTGQKSEMNDDTAPIQKNLTVQPTTSLESQQKNNSNNSNNSSSSGYNDGIEHIFTNMEDNIQFVYYNNTMNTTKGSHSFNKAHVIGSVPPLVVLFCMIFKPYAEKIATWKQLVRNYNTSYGREWSRRRAVEKNNPGQCPLCCRSHFIELCCNCGFFICKAPTCRGKSFPGQCPNCLDAGYQSAEPSDKWIRVAKQEMGLV